MSILDRLKGLKLETSPSGRRPPAAVELTQDGVLAASTSAPGAAPVVAFAALPAGALVPGLAEANLRTPETVANAVRTALDQVSPRLRAVTVVVPDSSARVFVLDFDTLPSKASEALPVLRFRLRKIVPFDVEQSAVSYQVLSQEKHAIKVLVTILPEAILAEYESAIRAAGYEPGSVLPSGLATLAAMHATEPILAAYLSGTSLTTAITHAQDVLLYRTVELPTEPEAQLADVQRGVAVAAAYFEDRLGVRPTQLHYAGTVDAAVFARAIAASELPVVEIATAPATGAVTTLGPIGLAGVTGSLAGAA